MSADLHIHVLTPPCTESDLAAFNSGSLDSKWFDPKRNVDVLGPEWKRVSKTPSIWIGSVSWLKAALFGDTERYVPDTIQAINELIGEDLPILDDTLTSKILGAFDAPNKTQYSLIEESATLRKFLGTWKGYPLFTVSW